MAAHAEVLDSLAPALVEKLSSVDGVVGVVLGGSRARGDHAPDSDYDLGIYYDATLDVAALQVLADEYSSTPAAVTDPGGWGPWVNGGGWLTVEGTAIDLIYRDLSRVRNVWAECLDGQFRNEVQAGHPLSMTNARKAAGRRDVAYVVGCMFRAVGVLTHAVHGFERRWLLNEKGAVAASDRLPAAPAAFAARVSTAFDLVGSTAAQLDSACGHLEALLDETVKRLS